MFITILLIILSPYTALIPGMFAMVGVFTEKYHIHLNPWNIGLLTLFAAGISSGILNKSLLSVLASLMLLVYFFLSIAIEDAFNTEEKILKFYLTLLYVSVIPGIIGIAEKICLEFFNVTLIKRAFFVTSELDGRIYSTFSNPNVAGGWFAAMILIAVFFWNRSESKSKLLLALLMGLYSSDLLLTGSRGAIMGLAAASVVLLVMKGSWRRLILPSIMLGILAVMSFIPWSNTFISNLMGHEISSSFTSRYPIWKGCIEMIFEKPFIGWGLMGVFEKGSLFIDGGKTVVHAHNIWLSILTTLGLTGFYVYLVMKAYLIYSLGTLKKNGCSLAPLLAAIQALVVVHGLVDFTISIPQTGILFITCSAFIASLSRSFSTTTHFQQMPAWTLGTGTASKYRID